MKTARIPLVFFLVAVMVLTMLTQSVLGESDTDSCQKTKNKSQNISTLNGGGVDMNKPTISAFTIGKTDAVPGETIDFSVKIEDESEVTYTRLDLISPNGVQSSFYMTPNSNSIYNGSFAIPYDALNGEWRFQIVASDRFGNSQAIIPDTTINITGGSDDINKPTISAFTVDKTGAVPNETIGFSVKIEDESEVTYTRLDLISPNGVYSSFYMTPNSNSIYNGSFTIPENALNGEWSFQIVATDKYGNNRSIVPDTIINVTGGVSDINKPTISAFTIGNADGMPGDTIDFSVKIEDESEITYMRLDLISPSGGYYSFYATSVSNSIHSGTFTIPTDALIGEWRFQIVATDKYGNNRSIIPDTIINVTMTDTHKPEITDIQVLPVQLIQGESITVTAIITDASPLRQDNMTAALTGPSGSTQSEIMTHLENNTYKANFTLPNNAELGNWHITINASDVYNNKNSVIKSDAFSVVGQAVTSIKITPADVTLTPGQTANLTSVVLPSNATIKQVIWKSDSSAVATIDANGKVKAHKAGIAQITAVSTDNGNVVSNICTVTVKPPEGQVLGETADPDSITKIHTANKKIYIKKGKTITLPVYAYADKKRVNGLKWSSNKKNIATVNQKGKIKAKKNGTVKITAKAPNGKKLTITVKVVSEAKKVKKISIIGAPKSMKVGAVKYLSVKINPQNATAGVIKWKSSKNKILTVDKAGRIVAKKKGTANVTATVGGKKITKKIKITK